MDLPTTVYERNDLTPVDARFRCWLGSSMRNLLAVACGILLTPFLACNRNALPSGPSSLGVVSAMPLVVPAPKQFVVEPIFISADINSHQGYAADAQRHFIFDTSVIYRRDAAWSLITSNRSPFIGTSGIDHLGDGDYFEGQLFVPAEQFDTCRSFGNEHVFVFNATTLVREQVHSISAIGHEASAVAVDGPNNAIYVSSFCDGARLFKYNFPSLSFDRTIDLTAPIHEIQGLAFRDGFLYASSESQRAVFGIDPLTGTVTEVLRIAEAGSYQGIDYSQNELRWLIDRGSSNRRVYFFNPR